MLRAKEASQDPLFFRIQSTFYFCQPRIALSLEVRMERDLDEASRWEVFSGQIEN